MIPLSSPEELRSQLPACPRDRLAVEGWRQTVADILSGKDRRLLIIVGPCAVHRIDATIEYASRLKRLSQELSDQVFVVMRAYVEKARSRPDWKGFLYAQTDEGSSVQRGIRLSRKLFIELVREGLPIAMEFLNPLTADYLSDLVTWGCIGARTVQSSPHRELASRLPMPVGMKNAPDGSVEAAVHGIAAARQSQTCLAIGPDGRVCALTSPGNPSAHLVLRGGLPGPNFQLSHIQEASLLLRQSGLPDGIVIDCSHGNSRWGFERQPEVFHKVLDEAISCSSVRGLMLESFLLDGKQKDLLPCATSDEQRQRIMYGASSVDGCLGWESSAALLRTAHAKWTQSKECVCC